MLGFVLGNTIVTKRVLMGSQLRSHRRRMLVVALPIFLAVGAKGAMGQTEAVLSRNFVIGTSPRVQVLMRENPQGHQFRQDLTELRVDERPVPGRCGLIIGRYFRSQLLLRFSVSPTSECAIAENSVSCNSPYLAGYSRLYLALTYTHTPAELDLKFDVRQLGLWGQKARPQLSSDLAGWFESTFDCLISLAECSPEPPVCARRQ